MRSDGAEDLPPDVLRAWQRSRSADGALGMDIERGFVGLVPVVNSFGQTIGGVVVTYSKAAFREQVAALTLRLLRAAGLVLVGFGLLALIGVWLGFRGMRRDMEYLRAALDGRLLSAALPSSAAAERSRITPIGDFAQKLVAIESNLASASSAFDAFDRTVASGRTPR